MIKYKNNKIGFVAKRLSSWVVVLFILAMTWLQWSLRTLRKIIIIIIIIIIINIIIIIEERR